MVERGVCVGGMYVHIYLKKADTYRHTSPRFFSLFGAYTAMLGDCQFVFQKKELIKNPDKFNLEGKIIVMTSVPPSCKMLRVVLGICRSEQLIP